MGRVNRSSEWKGNSNALAVRMAPSAFGMGHIPWAMPGRDAKMDLPSSRNMFVIIVRGMAGRASCALLFACLEVRDYEDRIQ